MPRAMIPYQAARWAALDSESTDRKPGLNTPMKATMPISTSRMPSSLLPVTRLSGLWAEVLTICRAQTRAPCGPLHACIPV